MKAILTAVALTVLGLLLGILGAIAARGAGGLDSAFLLTMPSRAGREGGILPVLASTGLLVGGALALAVPVGVAAALWLREFAAPGPAVRLMRCLTAALAGVPSILFGLFGFALFVVRLGWGWSLASGSATLALMLLPTIMQTTEAAMAAVPDEWREGAIALGATPERTLLRISLPAAAPGILTGVILALGRALGESAAVLLTAGSSLAMPRSLLDPGRSMAVHLYILATEGLSDSRTYATALLLAAGVLAVNLAAESALHRLRRGA